MNVFVLCTGRCGSVTFAKACSHITNFTSGHESRIKVIGPSRLDYPENHIEADCRLSWYLGRLWNRYGENPDARFVWLRRDPGSLAASFAKRNAFGIMHAYRHGICLDSASEIPGLQVAEDLVDTVTENILFFLKRIPSHRQRWYSLDNIRSDFVRFWEWIGAEGDLGAALHELTIRHNAS